MHKFSRFIKAHSTSLLLFGGTAVIYSVLALWRLGTLVPGLAKSEQAALDPYGWQGLIANPLFAPYELVRSAVFWAIEDAGSLISRLPGVLVGLIAVLAFTRLLQIWCSTRTAIFGSALFVCSAWLLHTVRFASPEVVYLAALPLFLLAHHALRKGEHCFLLTGVLALWSVALYIPGLVWLVLLQAVWAWRDAPHHWRSLGSIKMKVATLVVPVALVSFLAVTLTRNVRLLPTWLGLPPEWGSVSQVALGFADVPRHLFIHGPYMPEVWLGKLPILDVAALMLTILGLYFYGRNIKAGRSKAVFAYVLVSMLLVGLGGAVTLSLVVPALYLFAATGLAYLLREWLKTFPRNPFARSIGYLFIVALVSASCVYNLRSYYVAWPNHPVTKEAYGYRR